METTNPTTDSSNAFSAPESSLSVGNNSINPTGNETQFELRSDKNYYQAGFPQLYTVGYGYTYGNTAANQNNTVRPFAPNNWTITRTSVGVIVFTHNLGTNNILISFETHAPANSIVIVAQGVNDFTVNIVNAAGSLVDAAFGYEVSAIP